LHESTPPPIDPAIERLNTRQGSTSRPRSPRQAGTHPNKKSQIARTCFLGAILTLLFWKVFTQSGSYSDAHDASYALDLLAESGNVVPYPELDQQLLDSRKILLTTDINANSTKFVVASLFILNAQDPTTPIELYLRTNGGYYDDAFAVVDAIRMIEAPVNTYAIGGSHSSGTIIVASGTGTRSAYENAHFMVHDNLSKGYGNYAVEDLENNRIKRFWGSFKKIPTDWFSEAGDEMNYLDAAQALEMGIVDTILKPE
jgi:ATP-dependent Clp protease protease subunit